MPRSRQRSTETPVAYTYGSAEKLNAPTTETAARMADEQTSEQPIPETETQERVRTPRLQWNRSQLADHARTFGPLYVHDKVSPSEFVGTLLQQNAQVDMFADFNGFKNQDGSPADDVAWYPYEYSGHWTNRLIRATGQRAMASLLYKDALRSKVNLVYMDPPYDIDFRSNFQAAADAPESRETLESIPADPVAIRAYRDSYRDGVHSYLDGIYEQAVLARELLTDSGSFILQIGPTNVHQATVLLAEVFGIENHIATIPYRTTTNPTAQFLPEIGNWLIWFGKDKSQAKYHQMYEPTNDREAILDYWQHRARYEDEQRQTRTLTPEERRDPALIPNSGRLYMTYPCYSDHTSYNGRSDTYYHHPLDQPCNDSGWSPKLRSEMATQPHRDHICHPGQCERPVPADWSGHECDELCDKPEGTRVCPKGRKCGADCHAPAYPCPNNSQWRVSLRGLHAMAHAGRLTSGKNIQWKFYETEIPGIALNAIWQNSGRVTNRQYIVETPPRVLERCILMTTDPSDLVLDLTCGSGAMPVQAENWGRRWISVDVSAVSIAIARERISTTVYPYHVLKDSPDGHKADHELAQTLLPPHLRTSFTPLPSYGYDPANGFVNQRQTKVSAGTLAYGARSDKDIIYHPDRTSRDNRKCRVAAAFTVESDSPYRAVSPAQADTRDEDFDIEQTLTSNGFLLENSNAVTERIVTSLETSGILQPGADRFRVENLQPTEMPDVTHTGTLIAPGGERHKAHFYIGAEDEIITALKTGYAAQATTDFRDIEYLVMVGFSRDGEALTTNRRYPRLNILQVNAHRDLQLPHLKEGREDNAFTIISEPELSLVRQDDGKVCLSVLGLNAFNPATGLVEPPNTRNVMGIMVDTAYDGESFRVRVMNVKRVTRNQRTLNDLRAAIDKGGKQVDTARWEAMQTTTTVPFDLPDPGVKIAVKVIDQTGTEHMAVLDDPRDPQWYS